MELESSRYAETEVTTASRLYDGTDGADDFICYLLEDGHNFPKVSGETRIPPGRYRVVKVTASDMAVSHAKRFDWFRGLPGLEWAGDDPIVPEFTYLRMHPGVDHEDTAGCPLTATDIVTDEDGVHEGRRSVEAYRRLCEEYLYPAWDRGEPVFLNVTEHLIRL